MLPAVRHTNRSPKPESNTISGATRVSAHVSNAAHGRCGVVADGRGLSRFLPAMNRALPSRKNVNACLGVPRDGAAGSTVDGGTAAAPAAAGAATSAETPVTKAERVRSIRNTPFTGTLPRDASGTSYAPRTWLARQHFERVVIVVVEVELVGVVVVAAAGCHHPEDRGAGAGVDVLRRDDAAARRDLDHEVDAVRVERVAEREVSVRQQRRADRAVQRRAREHAVRETPRRSGERAVRVRDDAAGGDERHELQRRQAVVG